MFWGFKWKKIEAEFKEEVPYWLDDTFMLLAKNRIYFPTHLLINIQYIVTFNGFAHNANNISHRNELPNYYFATM